MSYSSGHETSDLRSYTLKGGARGSGGWVALLQCLRPQALPDPSCQRPGRAPSSHSRQISGVAPRRCATPSTPSTRGALARPPSRLLASQGSPRRLRRERLRDFTRDTPPRAQEARQTKQLMDPTDGRLGQLRRGPNREAGQWRNHPGNARKAWCSVGAGQALGREPRSGIRPQKRARDRLIRLAEAHPEWAVGFEDETWFSRFERPSLRSWADAKKPMHLLLRKGRERTIPRRRLSPAMGFMCPSWKRPG